MKVLNLTLMILLEYRISKYKNTFAKFHVSNSSEEIFVIKKVKNAVSWICVISDLRWQRTF